MYNIYICLYVLLEAVKQEQGSVNVTQLKGNVKKNAYVPNANVLSSKWGKPMQPL